MALLKHIACGVEHTATAADHRRIFFFFFFEVQRSVNAVGNGSVSIKVLIVKETRTNKMSGIACDLQAMH